MRREFHVRFCEGPRVKFPRATRRNVYVRSRRAGERVMQALRRLYATLHLRVNESKSAVAPVQDRKFLGFTFWVSSKNQVRCTIARKALDVMKDRVRRMTSRMRGRSLAQICQDLRAYLPGWKAYFRLVEFPTVFRELDAWIRHRLRALQLKQWKRGVTFSGALGLTHPAALC